MAWTAPTTFSVGQVLSAATLNTYVSDNLAYLKGSAGAITLDNNLGIGAAPSERLRLSTATGDTVMRMESLATSSNSAYQQFIRSTTGAARQWWQGVGINGDDGFSIYDQTSAAFRMHITAAGNVGLGITAPQGRFHAWATNGVGRFLIWDYDGVDGTTRVVVPDGSGDVLYNLNYFGVCRPSTGSANSPSAGGVPLTPGGSTSLYSSGSDILTIRVTAAGQVEVQRTGGSLTYKIVLMLIWI